jgi:hypothetical protein
MILTVGQNLSVIPDVVKVLVTVCPLVRQYTRIVGDLLNCPIRKTVNNAIGLIGVYTPIWSGKLSEN